MKLKTIVRRARKLAKRYRITDGSDFRLKGIDPSDTGKLEREDKGVAQELLTTGIQALAELQERLYAQDRWAVLLVFQAIDAAGKDSAIKHVMSGINPQGCQVYSFGVPSAHDLDHDYLWRCLSAIPERGRIGIFNRSYYEEVIVVRVHPEFLARQKVPDALLNDKDLWKHRFEDIRNVEQYLSRNGVLMSPSTPVVPVQQLNGPPTPFFREYQIKDARALYDLTVPGHYSVTAKFDLLTFDAAAKFTDCDQFKGTAVVPVSATAGQPFTVVSNTLELIIAGATGGALDHLVLSPATSTIAANMPPCV